MIAFTSACIRGGQAARSIVPQHEGSQGTNDLLLRVNPFLLQNTPDVPPKNAFPFRYLPTQVCPQMPLLNRSRLPGTSEEPKYMGMN